MKKLILILLVFSNLLFGAGREDLDNNFFLNDYQSSTDGICEPSCRLVSSNYETKIVDFDASSGVTSCEVYSKTSIDNEKDKMSIMANTLDIDCVKEKQAVEPDYKDSTLSSKKNNNYSTHSNITDYVESKTTMSKFIGGLATLDNDVIDIKNTVDTSTLVKSNPNSVYSVDFADADNPNELLSQIDSLNTNNLAFFTDLFYWLDSSYEYVTAYILVFISLFFMIIYFGKLGLKRLANKPTNYDEAYTTRFSVIIIAFAFFFFPLKFDDNYKNSLFQNMFKFFVYESTTIADKANKIALKSYTKYVYNTSGVSGIKEEATLKAMLKKQKLLIQNYNDALQVCEDRYQNEVTYQQTDLEAIKEIENKAGNFDDSVTFRGCAAIEKREKIAYTQKTNYEYLLLRIKSAYENNEIVNRLDKVSTVLNRRADELGWYSSVLAPSVKVITDLSFIASNETPSLQEEIKGKIRKSTTTEKEENRNWLEDLLSSGSQYAETKLGESFSQIIYLMFPGAGDIFSLGMQLGTGLSSLFSKIPAISIIGHMATPFLSLAMTSYIISLILQTLPLLTGIVATILAIVMYLYELIIYTLISPFVVLFAVTTGQSRKILDFLVTGLTIFLRPVLIVISVYLAMFFYSFVQDNVIVFSLEQFTLLQNSTSGFWITLASYLIKEILSIFAIFLSIYITWKTIVSGADYVYKMIGLSDISNTSQFAEELSQNYKSRYAFNA